MTEETNVEVQDEMQEILEESPPEQEQEQEIPAEESVEEKPAEEISPEKKAFLDGQKAMKEQMQEAVNRRISKEVSKRKNIENKFQAIAQEVQEIKQSVVKEQAAPKREQFNTDEEWVGAMIEARYGSKAKQHPIDNQVVNTPLAQAFTVKEIDYAKKNHNYYENIKNLTPFMNADLQECLFDAGPEVADYLSQNIDMAEQIAGARPAIMGRAIARIEERFKRNQPLPKKAQPKAEPVTETGNTVTPNNASSMNQWDYNRQRAKMDGFIK